MHIIQRFSGTLGPFNFLLIYIVCFLIYVLPTGVYNLYVLFNF